ncbi:MAG: protease modulator HflC [Devosia sp.]
MNRLVIAGIAVVALLYVFFSSLYVVNEREQAIVLRFGQIVDVRQDPGVYFKIPTDIVDTVQLIDDRILRTDITDLRVQVQGGAFYIVDAFLTYRITDPRLFRQNAQGQISIVQDRIATSFAAVLRQVYGLRQFNAALSEQRSQMMIEARDLIRPNVETLGIEVVDVRIVRTELDAEVFESTYNRMREERLAEAALIRARGQEAAQTLRAIAERQAVEIESAANRDSEIIRGQGDAERNRIFAAAYGQDPEFFEFYRSMQAYLASMAGDRTTMVLSPESEFFRYFGSNGTLPARNPNPAPPLAPTVVPELPTSEVPTLDGVSPDIAPPALTLEDGSTLEPTIGTDTPPPVEEPPAEAPAPADAPAVTTSPAPAETPAPATTP